MRITKTRLLCSLQRAMGTSATELRIKNEQIELMAKASRTLLETQAAMLEIGEIAEKNKTPPPPPPPPNREKIIAAGAPALASMYTATLAAITKTAPSRSPARLSCSRPKARNSNSSTRQLGNLSSK